MGIGFRRDDALSRRSAPPAEPCAAQIETAPKKVARTRLADETRTKLPQHHIRGSQNASQTVGILWVVGGMRIILIQSNRIGNLLRLGVDFNLDASSAQQPKQFSIKSGHRHGRKGHRPLTLRCAKLEAVVHKIELQFKRASAVRDRPRRQTSRGHIESNVPEMVLQRCQAQQNFSHDLGPHVQCAIRGFPLLQRQGGPVLIDCIHRGRLLGKRRVLGGGYGKPCRFRRP